MDSSNPVFNFGALPKELRDMIWDFAVQNPNDKNEAHFFQITDKSRCFEVHAPIHCHSCSYGPRVVTLVDAPISPLIGIEGSNGQAPSRTSPEGPSGYRMGEGLRLACREAHAAAVRHRTRFAQHSIAVYESPYDPNTRDLATGYWLSKRTEDDLIVILGSFLIESSANQIRAALRMASFLHGPGDDLPLFALEYDPRWLGQFPQDVAANPYPRQHFSDPVMAHRCAELPIAAIHDFLVGIIGTAYTGSSHFYVIDKDLIPSDDVSESELLGEMCEVWFANGRRYVEVRRHKPHHWRLRDGVPYEGSALELENLIWHYRESFSSVFLAQEKIGWTDMSLVAVLPDR